MSESRSKPDTREALALALVLEGAYRYSKTGFLTKSYEASTKITPEQLHVSTIHWYEHENGGYEGALTLARLPNSDTSMWIDTKHNHIETEIGGRTVTIDYNDKIGYDEYVKSLGFTSLVSTSRKCVWTLQEDEYDNMLGVRLATGCGQNYLNLISAELTLEEACFFYCPNCGAEIISLDNRSHVE